MAAARRLVPRDRKDPISIELRPKTTTAPALGVAYPLSIAVRNDATRSESVPITLTLTSPDGKHVDFYTTSVFAYASKESTEDLVTTPAQWFGSTGRYKITAASPSVRATAELAFDVVDPPVATPVFADVSEQAGVATSIPAAHCGQFANGAAWADVDGDDDPDLLVTRLGDPVQLFINDGKGHFDERGEQLGVGVTDANGAAFADYDNDGDADVLLVRDGTDLLVGKRRDRALHRCLGEGGHRRRQRSGHGRGVGRLRWRRPSRRVRRQLHALHRRLEDRR